MNKTTRFNWHNHGLLLFVAVTFGVSLSYLGISYFNQQSRAAALPLLQYISPDRTDLNDLPKYPICPHLITATVDGKEALQDLCTGLYWAQNDSTEKKNREHITSNDTNSPYVITKKVDKNVLGNNWYEAMGINPNGTQSARICPESFRLPTPDELLTLAFIPCGEIKYCENSTSAPILCQEDTDCARPPVASRVCSEGLTISCSIDRDCMDRGAGLCTDVKNLAYCSNNPSRSCDTTVTTSCDTRNAQNVIIPRGDGNCTPKTYSCVHDACSPIVRSFGSFKYTNLNNNPGTEASVNPTKRLLADGSYWTNRQIDQINGSQCTTHTGLSCADNAKCVGTCGLDNKCSNDSSVYCGGNDGQCNFGICRPFESAISVNLKYGTVNNPIMGKETLMNVRCVYEPPQ